MAADEDDPVGMFAADLRALMAAAGVPSYRELARRAHFSHTVIAAAAGGKVLPSLEVTLAFVGACGGDAAVWEERWRAVFEHRLPDDYPIPQAFLDDRRGLLALIESEIGDTGPSDPEERQDAARALFSATHGNVLLALDAKLGPFEPDRCERQIRFLVHHVVIGLGR